MRISCFKVRRLYGAAFVNILQGILTRRGRSSDFYYILNKDDSAI